MIERQEADVVILRYVDMLWAAQWLYPVAYKDEIAPVISELRESGLARVVERESPDCGIAHSGTTRGDERDPVGACRHAGRIWSTQRVARWGTRHR